MTFKGILASLATAAILVSSTCITTVHGEGYWTEGWWDDPTQTWHEGYWTETGSDSWSEPAATTSWAAPLTYYSQLDGQWSGVVIGNASTMAANGCVPTSASMILSKYGIYASPLDMAYMMNSWGDYNANYGHGAGSNAFIDLANNYGLSAWACYSAEDAIGALANGGVVAAIVYSGGGTHSVVLNGVDSSGNTTVYDPYFGIFSGNVYGYWNNRSGSWIDTSGGSAFIAFA